ncbi:energy-coupling factor ABC transporter ATP-binding protein [Gallibacterium sp. AGMB14963]|uniref:energy-coupling factor ABC transporter ATP-binding protein n=1 Tax=Gallibacterium faecale TaxID=3019086 RepID=UPI0022F176D9|nr:energy-coupling factor ABC transporter ATP-binding protein [Gallibacterium sp. AGMB14963]MDA3978789.1 energy-coupling factor ABC transporter ATP-binding protein [Gallibacterium sp. AGMB14963]
MSILSVKHICISVQNRTIIQNLSFQLEDRQRLFLLGEIGTGKTTLLHSLLGFVPIERGEIKWFGQVCVTEKDFQPLRGKVGLCFQNADDQLFGPSVLDDVAFGPLNQGLSKYQAYSIAEQQLATLDIIRLKDRSITALSGGEKTFVALAGVLAMQPKALLLDEPTTGLDSRNKDKLSMLLAELELPMIIASHDQVFIDNISDSVIYMQPQLL